jgi:hypothetical protein
MTKTERRPLAFQDAKELGEWLAKHHQSSSELWVQILKAGSGRPSVTWMDCVVEAIRFGWIDGQKLPLDEKSYLQRLTPRKPKSNWSAKNRCSELRAAVARLELAGDSLITIQVEGRLTTVKSEGGLVYLILCAQPDPRVLCVTYQENGREPGAIVVVSGAFAQVDPDHIQLDPCLHFLPGESRRTGRAR